MTIWRRRWRCAECGWTTLRTMSSQGPDGRTRCPDCGGKLWRRCGAVRLVCIEAGCDKDARSSGLCLKHEREAQRLKAVRP